MKSILFALTVLLSPLAFAEEAPNYYNVLSSVTLSFQENGGFDRAVLVQPAQEGGDATLYIYLSRFNQETRAYDVSLAFKKEAAAFSGSMWGMLPSLAVSSVGSLEIKSGNDAIGRDRWEQTLTVAYRHGGFYVVGITYSYRDTLEPNHGGSCDLNLLSGKGRRNGKRVAAGLKPVLLADWKEELLPKACQFD